MTTKSTLPATKDCPPWCILPNLHPYLHTDQDGSWMREHVAYDLTQPQPGEPKPLEVFVSAGENLGPAGDTVTARPAMYVYGVDGQTSTPGVARQMAAAIADACGKYETALLHWNAHQPA
jgi:hypothetical protein